MEVIHSKDKKKDMKNQVESSIVEQGHILGDWFVFRNERHFGPMNTKQVRHLLNKKMLANSHFVWRPGFNKWELINDVECFRSYGHAAIKNLTDDEFSQKAVLGNIDRIKWKKDEIEFIDSIVQNTYEKNKLTSYIREGLGLRVDNQKNVVGFFENKRNVSLLAIAILVVSMGLIFTTFQGGGNSELEGFSSAVKERFQNIASRPESIRNASFEAFEKSSTQGEPKLVMATNLPLGSRILIDVKGVPGTLLGAFRVNRTYETTLESKIFSSPIIRQENGKFIPPGEYSVLVSCLSCGLDKGTQLYSKDFVFNIEDRADYSRKLDAFHKTSRESAKLELIELSDVNSSLSGQFKKTGERFSSYSKSSAYDRWDSFSAAWLVNQRKLVDLFDQVNSNEFKESLYYASLYTAYSGIAQDLFELHILQDEMIKDNISSGVQKLEEQKLSAKIETEIASIGAKLNLMKVNFNKTNGLPTQAETKL